MQLRQYTPQDAPRRGRARRIWDAFERAGMPLKDLHYNANCWGQGQRNGWGTWACETRHPVRGETLYFCGEDGEGRVYIQQASAPYGRFLVVPK